MFVIFSILLGAIAGYLLGFTQMLGVILIFVISYVVLHKLKIRGQVVATSVWFMVYFLIAMFISGGLIALLS